MKYVPAALMGLALIPAAQAQPLNLSGYSLTFDWEADSFEPTQCRAKTQAGCANISAEALTTTLTKGWRTYATSSAAIAADTQEEQCFEDGSFGVNPFSLPGNGTLQITASPAYAAYCPGPMGDVAAKYVSGTITTEAVFSQTYGYFEMCAKMPAGAGMWPGFYLVPASGAEFPEIDVTEQLGTVQYWRGGPYYTHWDVHDTKFSGNSVGGWVKVAPNLQTGFHAYGVLWTPSTISFYFDGNQIASIPTPADANVPMYMIANISIGSTWAGPPAGETGVMQIDYIRAFKASATPVAQQPISSPDGGGTTLYGAKP